jgi:ABC-type transport system substrate-binding protein
MVDYDYETAHFEINEYFKGAWVNNTLPEDFQFDAENLDGVGSGSGGNSHTGANYFPMTKTDKDGNEYEILLVKPTIERISFSLANNDTAVEDLHSGKFHLINKMVYGPVIMELMGAKTQQALEAESEEGTLFVAETKEQVEEKPLEGETDEADIRFQNYPRIGLSFLTFTYEWPTVHDKEVRQAIAWCLDREGLTQDYTTGLGMVVDGYFGIEQWEYLICTGKLDYPVNFVNDETHTDEDLAEWSKHRNMYATTEEELEQIEAAWKMLTLDNLTHYVVDVDRANALLDSAHWTLNREGETYRPGVDDVRCKMVDGELVALDLSMMYPEGNHIVDTLQERFLDNLEKAGIRLTLIPEKMEELLKSYYREKERTTDMIYLATNFHAIVDPAITYSTDKTANHLIWNNTYSDDEDLYYRAVNMRQTDPLDVYDYVSKWISFQERYNEVLPTIPIYSNLYFDFFTSQLQNYHVTAHVTWSQAILEAYFGEETETSAANTAEDDEFPE